MKKSRNKKAKPLNEKISRLVRVSGLRQSDIASSLDMPPSQLSRFINGHGNLNLENFLALMKLLNIDIIELLNHRLKYLECGKDDDAVNSDVDCLIFLYESLDSLGKQTLLNSAAWASRLSSQQDLPVRIQKIIKRESTLV